MRTADGGLRVGILIGGCFGLVYVLVNAGALPEPAQSLVRPAGTVAFLGLFPLMRRARSTRFGPADAEVRFTRAYWGVGVAEAVAIVVGARVLAGPLDFPEATLPWVTIVVGSHFFALATIWRIPMLHGVAGVLMACGVVGMAAAVADQSAAVAVVAGVLPGAVLLASCYWAVLVAGRQVAA